MALEPISPELTGRLRRGAELAGAVDPTLSGTISPVVIVDDFQFPWARNPRRGINGVALAAVAAQYSYGGVQAGAGNLVVVDKIVISSPGVAADYYIGLAVSPTGLSLFPMYDVNAPTNQTATLPRLGSSLVSQTSASSIGTAVLQLNVPASGIVTVDNPGIVLDGRTDSANPQSVLVFSKVVNTPLFASFYIREFVR